MNTSSQQFIRQFLSGIQNLVLLCAKYCVCIILTLIYLFLLVLFVNILHIVSIKLLNSIFYVILTISHTSNTCMTSVALLFSQSYLFTFIIIYFSSKKIQYYYQYQPRKSREVFEIFRDIHVCYISVGHEHIFFSITH